MAIKPMLFNTEMVQAILDGRKTCTRRLVNPRQFMGMLPDRCKNATPDEFLKNKRMMFKPYCNMTDAELIMTAYKPPYQPGDILYVRETWCARPVNEAGHMRGHSVYYYKADGDLRPEGWRGNWHPSIHMPKEAARIWLKVTDVRVERLQDITENQAEEEVFLFTPPCLRLTGENYCDIDGPCTSEIKYCDMGARELFGTVLWSSTIKKSDLDRYGWSANPYVFVIEFERCEKPEGV